MTEFLDHAQTRPPITLYLFHLVRQLLDGRRLVCWMDEFWRLLSDPAFESFAKDGPKTWRKLNAVMCLATQSPSDVLQSSISRTLVEQTPTKMFFPNSDANYAEYTEGFGLTEREFRLIKEELEPGSRMFLVKQSHHSVVCQLDLKGFDAELAVISGRATQVARMNEIMATLGAAPRHGCRPSWPRIPKPRDHRSQRPVRGDSHVQRIQRLRIGLLALSLAAAPAARAQWAVVDVGAIDQLIQEVQTMSQQLITAEAQLQQAKNTLQSMSGGRGMQTLLAARTAITSRPAPGNSPARCRGAARTPG